MPAEPGNDYARKFPTPEARQQLCTDWCEHIASGYSKTSFPLCNIKTIKSYIDQFPEDFPPEKIERAEAENLYWWEKTGMGGMLGKLPGFNAACWIFNMKNRHGWRDKTETAHTGAVGVSEISVAKAEEWFEQLRSGVDNKIPPANDDAAAAA